jgi:thiol:disulfide interchange protein DsbG
MKTVFVLIATLLVSACAPAGTSAAQPSAAPPAASASAAAAPAPAASVVQRALAANGVAITGSLEAPAGFEGFVAQYQGRELPVYALPDGKHIVIGSLLDLDGHDLTGPALAKVTSSSLGEAQWKALEGSNWVAEGDPHAKRIVYVFVDTRCPYCHHLWQASQPFLKKGGVQVRNILVGVIKAESLPEAAHILAARDPTAAWVRNESNFGKNPTPSNAAPAAAVDKVRANAELMQELGFMGTPGIVWKDAQGKIQVLQGMPRDNAGLDAVFSG